MGGHTGPKSIDDLNWQMKITGSSTAFVRLHFKDKFSPDPGPDTPVPLFQHSDHARTLWNDFLSKVEKLPCHESTSLAVELCESQLVFLIISFLPENDQHSRLAASRLHHTSPLFDPIRCLLDASPDIITAQPIVPQSPTKYGYNEMLILNSSLQTSFSSPLITKFVECVHKLDTRTYPTLNYDILYPQPQPGSELCSIDEKYEAKNQKLGKTLFFLQWFSLEDQQSFMDGNLAELENDGILISRHQLRTWRWERGRDKMELCNKCESLLAHLYMIDREDPEEGVFYHHQNILDLKTSATQGINNGVRCSQCSQWYCNFDKANLDIMETLTSKALAKGWKVPQLWVEVQLLEYLFLPPHNYENCWVLKLRAVCPEEESDGSNICQDWDKVKGKDWRNIDKDNLSVDIDYSNEIYQDWLSDESDKFFRVASSIELIPNLEPDIKVPKVSKLALPRAKEWYHACKNHLLCRTTVPQVLPKRLVSIEGSVPKLCITTGWPKDKLPEYAALSHCWGDQTNPEAKLEVLTKSTVQKFEVQVPDAALSRSFRDGMSVAKYLGLQYIWIDSLCIIQGDENDWREQSALMSLIFGSASITIAATGARDGRDGCFLDRNREQVIRQHVLVQDAEPDTCAKRDYTCVVEDFYGKHLVRQPLNTRGWVVQERFLSPRILHFTPSQLFWECNTTIACEHFPYRIPPQLTPGDWFLDKRPVTRNLWNQIVAAYTSCNLTSDRDILVAISGLATIINDQIQDVYLAGLWRQDLEAQLCWYGRPSDNISGVYLGPTWSWVGRYIRDCRLSSYDTSRARFYARVLTAQTTTFHNSPLGLLDEKGTNVLQLRCEVFHCFNYKYEPSKPDGRFYPYTIEVDDYVISLNIRWDTINQPSTSESLYLLPIMDTRHLSTRICGLILLQAKEKGEHGNVQYKRAGTFTICSSDYLEFETLLEELGDEEPNCEVSEMTEEDIEIINHEIHDTLDEKSKYADVVAYEGGGKTTKKKVIKVVDII